MMISGPINKKRVITNNTHIMKTTMLDKEQLRYIKRFKTLLNEGKIDRNAELAMLSGYGVDSCKDMNAFELLELCNKLQLQINPDLAKLDKLRKRVLASINGWLELTGRTSMSMEYIKTIACRAAEVNEFNRINESSLNSILAEFNRKQKIVKNTIVIKEEIVTELKQLSNLN